MEIKELSKYVNDDMLNEIYISREEKLHKSCEQDKKERKWIDEEYPADYDAVIKAIKEFAGITNEEKMHIIEILDEFCMREEIYADYGKEKYYKIGFCDGIRMMVESIKVA